MCIKGWAWSVLPVVSLKGAEVVVLGRRGVGVVSWAEGAGWMCFFGVSLGSLVR